MPIAFITLWVGYMLVYSGISKFAPSWTNNKKQSWWEASGAGNIFGTPATLTSAQTTPNIPLSQQGAFVAGTQLSGTQPPPGTVLA